MNRPQPVAKDLPSTDPAAHTTPESATTFYSDCFILTDGVLYFDQSRYDDYPIVIIPETIDGQAVTAIGPGCFDGVSGITTIILPSSITRIDVRAFADCDDLRGLCIPEGVTSIAAEAFYGCESLEAVYIPTAVNSIGEKAFADCPAMVYLFYSGFYSDLYNMYPEVITPFTWAICLDGEYPYAAQ